jgi:hypothetical protein
VPHRPGPAIIRAIADAHGANVEAAARAGGGLDITVAFPAGQAFCVSRQAIQSRSSDRS